jgi:uroporphyrinogen-III synthase
MDTPLRHTRIAITRAAGQADELVGRLAELGVVVVRAPTIAIAPPPDFGRLDAALQRLDSYSWVVFTSANAVSSIVERIRELGVEWPDTIQIAAVGAATARVLRDQSLTPAVVPAQHTAVSLLHVMNDIAGQRLFLPQADLTRETLAAGLRERGATVDTVVSYQTIAGPGAAILAPLLTDQTLDAIVFTSPSTIDYLIKGLEDHGVSVEQSTAQLNQLTIVCIGPVTALAARERGLRVTAEAAQQSSDGIIQALIDSFEGR